MSETARLPDASGAAAADRRVLGGWRFSADPALTQRFLLELVEDPPALASGPAEASVGLALEGLDRAASLRSARAALGLSRVALRPAPEDELVRGLWAWWFDEQPWGLQRAWERLFLPDAIAAFKAVLVLSRLAPSEGPRVIAELRDWFFYALVDGRDGVSGWRDVAARLFETDPVPDIERLARVVPTRSWGRVARCVCARGHGPATARLLAPDAAGTQERALLLQAWYAEDPEAMAVSLDLHLAQRLVDGWRWCLEQDEARDARILTQNRGRAWGRLRAVLQEAEASALRPAVLGLDCLMARTRLAVRRYALDLARRQVEAHFTLSSGGSATAPCSSDDRGLEPYTIEDLPVLRAWVLLAVLRGCGEQLRQWADPGARAGNGGTWGRLLHKELPEMLLDPPSESRRRTYHRLRAELSIRLDAHDRAIEPALRRVAALRPPYTRARFERAIEGSWHPDVHVPRGGYAALVRGARAHLRRAAIETVA